MEIIIKIGDREVIVGEEVEKGYDLNLSCYAVKFDVGNPYRTDEKKWNLIFLRSQQEHANNLLRKKGHLFLNEVYGMIGVPATRLGQLCGWICDPMNPIGDNYVDFGLTIIHKDDEDFEDVYILDPNVDGIILDKI